MVDKNNNENMDFENLIFLLNKKDLEIKKLKNKNVNLKNKNKKLKKKINEYESSKSLKLTKPFRIFKKNLNSPTKKSEYYNNSESIYTKTITQFDEKVSIIIPIYNAFEDTKNCIESIFRNTSGNFELILIDDNSDDQRIGKLLKDYEDMDNVRIKRNNENKGFVKNVNFGMEISDGDVILLNSDTIVTPKWLQKLIICAYSKENIGTVTPVSNNAGAFSVPKINTNNIIPNGLKIDGMANLVEKSSDRIFMEVPTANGFCMYIKRDTINSVGLFDYKSFGRGYGEENDFSMRAINKGWINVIDDSCYIYHHHGASFGEEKKQLMEKNAKILELKHPNYNEEVRKFLNSNKLKKICDNVESALEDYKYKKVSQKNLLYVLSNEKFNLSYISQSLKIFDDKNFNYFLLIINQNQITLFNYFKFNFEKLESWKFKKSNDANKNKENLMKIYYIIFTKYFIDFVYLDDDNYEILKDISEKFSIDYKLNLV